MNEQKLILLVEDDRVDAMTVKRALKEINVTNPMHVARNGVEALEFLRDPTNPQPAIILLDLNMPRMNGIELVRQARQDPRFVELPVIIVSYKDRDEDRLLGLEVGANSYLTKGSFHDDSFVNTVADLIGDVE